MKTKHGKVEGKILETRTIGGVKYRLVKRETTTTAYRYDAEKRVWVYVAPRKTLKAFEEASE
jgi:hypothetical protein